MTSHIIAQVRQLVEMLPSGGGSRGGDSTRKCFGGQTRMSTSPGRNTHDVYDLVGIDNRKEYDVRVSPLVANAVGAVARRFGARWFQVVQARRAGGGNRPRSQRLRTKTAAGEKRVIYPDAADKAPRGSVMEASQTGLPLVFFQDVSGFMVGADAEHAGIVGGRSWFRPSVMRPRRR